MAVNKNFVVKNGFEVSTDLILANASTRKVGIASTNPQYELDVAGTIGVENVLISGVGTFSTINVNNANINDAHINIGIITSIVASGGTITSLNGTNLNYTGISTLIKVESTQINSQNLSVSGISTLNNIVLDGYLSIGNTTGKLNQVLVSTGVGVSWGLLSRNSQLVTAAPGQDTFLFSYEIGSVEIYINGVRLSPDEFTATDGSSVVLDNPCFGEETVEIIASQTLPVGTSVIENGITVRKDNAIVGAAASITNINFTGAGVAVTTGGSNQVDVSIDVVSNPPGKVVYVATNGNDGNNGLTLDTPKATIKAAVGIASSGDTVKVSPGTYIEDNPITLPENVAIEGAELRNCIVTPLNPGNDLFWVTNGTHITDLSFQGQTSSASVIAFKPLVGVASNRYFDAARIIRYNLDFIAAETVGYLTSTDYRSPAFTLTAGISTVTDDIKNVYRALSHDITRGGNSKCVGVGLSYYDEYNVGIKTEIIDAIYYSAGIAQSCINNVLWNGNYQTEFGQLRDLSIQADPATGSNIDNDSCANVVSSIYSCVGVVTTIINQGPSVVGTSFNLTYPGNAGIGTTNPNDIPSQGVGNVTKGPYIRNCTNFIPGSVGMKVDGFNADPGDQDDMGITGMMSVDSYTQYNQGGIGVSITNGAYAQLVSIFTICDDIAIFTGSGGQCDITNSNSSFGRLGLYSDGVGDEKTKSIYRSTGVALTTALEKTNEVIVSGVGNYRPYDGQVCYFGELLFFVDTIEIIDGGSGYTAAPRVIISSPEGANGITAQASSVVENGRVTAINIVNSGTQYRNPPTITIAPPTNSGSTATAKVGRMQPIYYKVDSATLPSSGISTISLLQNLNNTVSTGTTVYFSRVSLQITSSHSFEWVGSGNDINKAKPALGGVVVPENEVVQENGGLVVYTSTDQAGNFKIGDGVIINQATGQISGRDFTKALFTTMTPFILALSE